MATNGKSNSIPVRFFDEEGDAETESLEIIDDELDTAEGDTNEGEFFEIAIPSDDVADASASPQEPREVRGDVSSGPMLAELVATRAELKRVEAELADVQDRLTRRQADFENYRKRVERERGETYNRVVADVVNKFLPVIDNLRRAVDAERSLEASESPEFRHFLQGVELINKQLDEVLEAFGVEAVPAHGERFDPHLHEAVVTEATEEYEPDTVIQEIVRGYRLGEKLLRPAMVKVSTGPAADKK
jgi:molecular chaperone GrpE